MAAFNTSLANNLAVHPGLAKRWGGAGMQAECSRPVGHLTWVVETAPGTFAVAKLAQAYPWQVHQAWAQAGLAPALYPEYSR